MKKYIIPEIVVSEMTEGSLLAASEEALQEIEFDYSTGVRPIGSEQWVKGHRSSFGEEW